MRYLEKLTEKSACGLRRPPPAFAAAASFFFALSLTCGLACGLAWGAGEAPSAKILGAARNQSASPGPRSLQTPGGLSHGGPGALCRLSFESPHAAPPLNPEAFLFPKLAAWAPGLSAPAPAESLLEGSPGVYTISSGDFSSSLHSHDPLFSYKGEGAYALNKAYYARLLMILELAFFRHQKGLIVTSSLVEARSLKNFLLRFLPDLEESVKLEIFHKMLPPMERKKIQESARREGGHYILSVQTLPDSIDIPPAGIYIDLNVNKTVQSRMRAAADLPLIFFSSPAPDILLLNIPGRKGSVQGRTVKEFLAAGRAPLKPQKAPAQGKETKMSLEKAMRIVRPFRFSSAHEFYRWARSAEAPETFPRDPYQYYRNRGLWPGWAVFLGLFAFE